MLQLLKVTRMFSASCDGGCEAADISDTCPYTLPVTAQLSPFSPSGDEALGIKKGECRDCTKTKGTSVVKSLCSA